MDAFDLERDGHACLVEMEQACQARRRGAMREALVNAANYMLMAEMELPKGGHKPDVVTRVGARMRTLKFAA